MSKHPAVGGVLLSLIVLLVSLPNGVVAAPQGGPHGVWNGAIEIPGQTLEIIITLQEEANGSWTGLIDIPAQGLADFALSDIAVAADSVTFSMAGVPGEPRFVGSWDAEKQTISGDFEQGGQAFPFRLARSGDAAPASANTSVDAETAAKVVGSWSGSLSAGGGQVRLVFHVEYADGRLSGTMDSPDQGQEGLPISEITFDGSTLRVDLTYAGAYFEGTLSADGSKVEGSWNQGGGAAPLTMEKQ